MVFKISESQNFSHYTISIACDQLFGGHRVVHTMRSLADRAHALDDLLLEEISTEVCLIPIYHILMKINLRLVYRVSLWFCH